MGRFRSWLYWLAKVLGDVNAVRRGVDDQDSECLACEILAEHAPEGFRLPINLMFTDARGEAARVIIETPKGYTIVH